MGNFLHRCIRKIVYLYEQKEVSLIKKDLLLCGEKVCIEYPKVVSHRERISIGNDVHILRGARIQCYPELSDMNPYILIGNGCYLGYNLTVLAAASVTIGDKVLMASDVTIVSHNHGIDPESDIPYMDQKLIMAPISIGDNTWIGEKAIILPGVNIGCNCIVGAGSVVTHSIPDNCIAVGNPAKIIKKYSTTDKRWNKI